MHQGYQLPSTPVSYHISPYFTINIRSGRNYDTINLVTLVSGEYYKAGEEEESCCCPDVLVFLECILLLVVVVVVCCF